MFDIDERYVESAAYHEAAHLILAAVQSLSFGPVGFVLSRLGGGFACYRDKKLEGSSDSAST